MKLSGSFVVPGRRCDVYRFLTDPQKIAGILPDVDSATAGGDGFAAVVRVGVGPMRGTMQVRLAISERETDTRAVYQGQGQGLGSTVDLAAAFSLRDADGGARTAVEWSSDATIGGRLASVAGGLLEVLARKNIERFVAAVQRTLETGV